jgi:hypothetical protein
MYSTKEFVRITRNEMIDEIAKYTPSIKAYSHKLTYTELETMLDELLVTDLPNFSFCSKTNQLLAA